MAQPVAGAGPARQREGDPHCSKRAAAPAHSPAVSALRFPHATLHAVSTSPADPLLVLPTSGSHCHTWSLFSLLPSHQQLWLRSERAEVCLLHLFLSSVWRDAGCIRAKEASCHENRQPSIMWKGYCLGYPSQVGTLPPGDLSATVQTPQLR